MNKEAMGATIAPPEMSKAEAYKMKVAFINEAIKEGAHLRLPIGTRLSIEQWQRRVDIGLKYNLNETIVEEDIGRELGISRERVRQLNVEFIQYLWTNSSEKTKKSFSLEKIIFDKPVSQATREKISEKQEGTSLQIRQLVEKGITGSREIASRLNIDHEQVVQRSRETLQGWGVPINIERKTLSYKELKEKVEKETNDKKLQEILNDIPFWHLRTLITKKRKRIKQTTFSPLTKVMYELGIDNKKAKLVASVLASIDIPIRTLDVGAKISSETHKYSQKYHVIFTKHRQRIKNIIKAMEISEQKIGANELEKIKNNLICVGLDKKVLVPKTLIFFKIPKIEPPEFAQKTNLVKF